MPSSPPVKPTLHLLPPPNPSVLTLTIATPTSFHPPSPSGPPIPQPFLDALSIRITVFKLEQGCPIEMEIDNDDTICWHWVVYVRLGDKGEEKGKGKGDGDGDGDGEGGGGNEEGEGVPVATIRLIPARHDTPSSSPPLPGFEEPNIENSTVWDRREPYVTIGRLATLQEFRGRGYAKLLMEEALEFAAGHGGNMVFEKDREEMGQWKGLVMVHAQKRLEGWYRGLGFEGDEGMGRWVEGGIEHLGMWRRVGVRG